MIGDALSERRPGRPIDWYDTELAAMHERVLQGAGAFAAAEVEAGKSRQDVSADTLRHCYPLWAALAENAGGTP